RRTVVLPAEVARGRAGAVRLVARPPWDQDARRADAPPLRERARDRIHALAPSARGGGLLSGPADASGARNRGAADARLRRDDLVPCRVGGRRGRARRADEDLQ